MQIRIALVPLALVVAVAAPGASAAPKSAPKAAPTCNTIKDPAGDTFAARSQDAPPNGGSPQYGPQEDGLDVISADLASDGKVVTAAVRIAKLSRSIALSPTGMATGIEFSIGANDTIVRLQAVLVTGQPDRFEVTSIAGDALPNSPSTYVGAATGVVDLPKNEVRITAPAELLAPFGPVAMGVKLIPGAKQSATTGRATPVQTTTPGQPASTRGTFADVAIGGTPVVVGAPSCVVPGK